MKNQPIDLTGLLADKALLLEVRELLASDQFAASFQSLGSYRAFMLQHIRNNQQARAQLVVISKLEDL